MKITLTKNKASLSSKTKSFILAAYVAIIIAYIGISTYTPDLNAIDTNAPAFWILALFNLLTFIFLKVNSYTVTQTVKFSNLFSSSILIIYSLFILANLVSVFQANNMSESMLHLAKIFTVFASVVNISLLLNNDLRLIRLIIYLFAGMLIFDAFSVFYNIYRFIEGEVMYITDIKTVYSNKNILAAALFTKLPFAIWLILFEKRWLNRLGWIALTLGMAAILFMASRAFYMGLIVVSVVTIVIAMTLFFHKNNKIIPVFILKYLGAVLIAFLAFTITQSYLYPTDVSSRHTVGITEQIESISKSDLSTGHRLSSWKYSWKLFKENPILGIGAGNWKTEVLKFENQDNQEFKYLYKAHNDFIEIITETGILGGGLYIGLFVLIVITFFNRYLKDKESLDLQSQLLTLAAAGIFFYSFDAFFNFPADRPEMQALFAVFVSIAIVASNVGDNQSIPKKNLLWLSSNSIIKQLLTIVYIVVLSCTSYILYLNFQSSKMQRLIFHEVFSDHLIQSAESVVSGFPSIPSITVWGEPVVIMKARYLMSENQIHDAIRLLKNDQSSPYDSRKEFWLARAYFEIEKPDSARYYFEKAHNLKPNFYNTLFFSDSLHDRLTPELSNQLIDKQDAGSWLDKINNHINNHEYEKAYDIVTLALKNFPGDSSLQNQQRYLYEKLIIEPNLPIFNQASEHFQSERYEEAIELISTFIEKVPGFLNAYLLRSFSYYNVQQYELSISDANRGLQIDPTQASLINIRGVCYLHLENHEKACKDFLISMELGNQSGESNYHTYCKGL
jgi:putative inorganic carbon (hco3(-)) transporter